jgi:DNA-binding NtrC family response regulator
VQQKILAVDDQPHMLILIERIIKERTPYNISTTNNPLEVPKMLESEEFDLIISDLKMPGIDGLEILDFVNKNERKEKVIIITAFGDLETAIKAMQRGAFDYITKPFKKEQILHTVDRAMSWQTLAREADTMTRFLRMFPYDHAEKAFKKAYIIHLAQELNNQVDQIIEKSGLSENDIKQFLQNNS